MPQPSSERQNKYQNCLVDDRDALYGNVPNRHERLFLFGKSGITCSKVTLQVTYLLSIIYLSSQLVFNLKKVVVYLTQKTIDPFTSVESDVSNQSLPLLYIFLHVLPLFMMFIIWIACLPKTMARFTVITNIEMMKDQSLIEKVIAEQKLERSKRSQRIFQVMKVIRRELAHELKKQIQDKRLRGVTKKHIVESF